MAFFCISARFRLHLPIVFVRFACVVAGTLCRMKCKSHRCQWIFAVVVLLAGSVPTHARAQTKDSDRLFDFHVVGPDGKPAANAELQIRATPPVESDQIRRGTFVRKGNYSTLATADESGQLTLTLPDSLTRFSVTVKEPGFGPFSARWETGSPPETFTAELESVWSIGGVVVDEKGFPVEGAEVDPSIRFKQRAGDTPYYVGDRVRTDPEGKWRYDNVPESMTDVGVPTNTS